MIFKRRTNAAMKKTIASPINGISKVYLSARYPMTDEEGLARRISIDR